MLQQIPKDTKNFMGNLKKFLIPVLVVLLLVAGGTALAFYRQLQEVKQNPQKMAQEEVRALVARVGQLLVLPEGEDPTVATVQDPERLKEQPFFAKAKKGDRVLIYTNARKAILYSPTDQKIVEVAPINIGNPAAPAAGGAPAQPRQ